MAGETSGRTLRGLAAELAELGEDDLQTILAAFDGHDRSRLLDLIGDYRRGDQPATADRPAYDGDYSPWLADRLSERRAAGMTPHATAALRQVAADDGRIARTPPPPGARPPLSSLFARWGVKR